MSIRYFDELTVEWGYVASLGSGSVFWACIIDVGNCYMG